MGNYWNVIYFISGVVVTLVTEGILAGRLPAWIASVLRLPEACNTNDGQTRHLVSAASPKTNIYALSTTTVTKASTASGAVSSTSFLGSAALTTRFRRLAGSTASPYANATCVRSCMEIDCKVKCKGKGKIADRPAYGCGEVFRLTRDPDYPRLVLTERKVWWLHFPKTGTSFTSSINLCAPSTDRGQQAVRQGNFKHTALAPAMAIPQLKDVVVMFRDPSQRQASAYYWMQKNGLGCCGADWGWKEEVYKPIREAIVQGASISALGSFTGCMTNMILGSGCMSRRQLNSRDIEEAKARIKEFLFVGLQEEWALSMCLFNYLLTGKRFLTTWQMWDTRATGKKTKLKLNYSIDGLPEDVADKQIFQVALDRFWSDVRKHEISELTCKFCK